MIVHMNYQQYWTARRLVHSYCNYDCGNCLLLDNGEECICPQSITYSLICNFCHVVGNMGVTSHRCGPSEGLPGCWIGRMYQAPIEPSRGNCLLLDNGEECICPQSITYSLICKWFRPLRAV